MIRLPMGIVHYAMVQLGGTSQATIFPLRAHWGNTHFSQTVFSRSSLSTSLTSLRALHLCTDLISSRPATRMFVFIGLDRNCLEYKFKIEVCIMLGKHLAHKSRVERTKL
jgi:hypothetical protein